MLENAQDLVHLEQPEKVLARKLGEIFVQNKWNKFDWEVEWEKQVSCIFYCENS